MRRLRSATRVLELDEGDGYPTPHVTPDYIFFMKYPLHESDARRMPGAVSYSSIVGVIDHLAQQIQHRNALGRIEITHGQFADAGSMRHGVTH